MRAIASLALATLATAALAAPAFAARAPAIVVPIDQSTRLTTGGSAYSVVLGNPTVADVTVVDSHTLFISGRSYGTTDVTVLDRGGSTLFNGEIVVTATDVGRVSIYRGAARTDMACAPTCAVSSRSGGGGGGGAAPAPSASAPSAVPQALAAATGGGATP